MWNSSPLLSTTLVVGEDLIQMTGLLRTWAVLVTLIFLTVSDPGPDTHNLSLDATFELMCPMKENPERYTARSPPRPRSLFVLYDLPFWQLLFILLNSVWGNSEKLSPGPGDWGNACTVKGIPSTCLPKFFYPPHLLGVSTSHLSLQPGPWHNMWHKTGAL